MLNMYSSSPFLKNKEYSLSYFTQKNSNIFWAYMQTFWICILWRTDVNKIYLSLCIQMIRMYIVQTIHWISQILNIDTRYKNICIRSILWFTCALFSSSKYRKMLLMYPVCMYVFNLMRVILWYIWFIYT